MKRKGDNLSVSLLKWVTSYDGETTKAAVQFRTDAKGATSDTWQDREQAVPSPEVDPIRY